MVYVENSIFTTDLAAVFLLYHYQVSKDYALGGPTYNME